MWASFAYSLEQKNVHVMCSAFPRTIAVHAEESVEPGGLVVIPNKQIIQISIATAFACGTARMKCLVNHVSKRTMFR